MSEQPTIEQKVSEILQPFKALLAKGYELSLTVRASGCTADLLMGGDCNCPKRKYYDPADGHGFTYVHSDDIELAFGIDDEAEYNLAMARVMATRATALEAKPKE